MKAQIQPIQKVAPALSLKRLLLTNFRSYQEACIETDSASVVLTGANGSGKTNLLEAISMLAPGRGMRNATLDEQAYCKTRNPGKIFAATPWAINATIRDGLGEDVSIGTGVEFTQGGKEKRIVKINGHKERGQAPLAEYFSVCYLTPRMDSLFVEGSTSRRQYLDRLTYMLLPEHARHLAVYEYAKSERMKLLKRNSSDGNWISVLERRMAEKAVAIAAARKEAISLLQTAINQDDSGFPSAILAVSGKIENDLEELSAMKAEDNFADILLQDRRRDAESGKTHEGTHKSDFVVYHEAKNLPADLSSTGEQKAILLSITLASVRAKANWSGTVPVLLLDEVIAHLDDKKRALLIAAIEALGAQCWMTGTDTDFFAGFKGRAQFFNVDNSTISR